MVKEYPVWQYEAYAPVRLLMTRTFPYKCNCELAIRDRKVMFIAPFFRGRQWSIQTLPGRITDNQIEFAEVLVREKVPASNRLPLFTIPARL
jgi:hypothetical protein